MAGEGVGVGGTYVTRSSFDSTSDKHISSMKNNKYLERQQVPSLLSIHINIH